jgi:lipid II:glycine glycyltransferase (peptidoglycan interpeptide bridge formation enzyme)
MDYYPLRRFGFKENFVLSMFINLQEPQEQLFANLDGKCRNMVKSASSGNLECRVTKNRQEWLSFYDMSIQTLGSLADSIESFIAIWDHFIQTGQAFSIAAFREDKPIAVVICVYSKFSCYYWKGFRNKQNSPNGCNNLLIWKSILKAKDLGCIQFEMGSLEFGSGKSAQIAKFKQGFAGKPRYQFRGSYVRSKLTNSILTVGETLVSYVKQYKFTCNRSGLM